MSDVWYLALAYGVIWLGLFAYLFRLAGRAEALRRDVALLKGMLQGEYVEAERAQVGAMTAAAAASGEAGGKP
ncbi:MAG: hypothetical protein A2Y61_04340 [Chloroflexi bacterium RBG_13_60_13]|nr:MAG: hypothetical protein A2Y61_04340 [Chloroflexi bacterium RBG_13_60_13]